MRLRSPYTPVAERTSMKFRSLHDRVVIRRAEGDPLSKGGITIPDTATEKPQRGEVVAVGTEIPGIVETAAAVDKKKVA